MTRLRQKNFNPPKDSETGLAINCQDEGLKIENFHFHTIGPLNLNVAKSECIGITGPSGVGKTLFLRAVADMDPWTGKISLHRTESVRTPPPEWRKQVGLLPSESVWWFDTVREHFSISRNEFWKQKDIKFFEALGFETDVLNWKVSRLSSGERQRLAVLRLIANQPEALLLDEPTANLDAENIARVEKFLEMYWLENQAAVIWVSHDTEQLKRVSNRRFLMENRTLTESSE